MKEGDQVVELIRARRFSDNGVILETISLPDAVFPGFKEQLGDARPVLLYEFYAAVWGVRIASVGSRLSAVTANAQEAAEMNLSPGDPVLRIERVAYALDGAPVELRVSLCDTSSGRYYLHM